MPSFRCHRCRNVCYPLHEVREDGRTVSVCYACLTAVRDEAQERASRRGQGSDYLVVPPGCMPRLLFVRWLVRTGRLSEKEKVLA